MSRISTNLALVTLLFTLIGCSSEVISKQDVNTMKTFDLVEFFSGDTLGSGFVQDRSGEITRTFEVVTVGVFNNDSGTLKETFTWNDGEVEERIWTLNQIQKNEWSGTAPDVIGTAKGKIKDDKLRWSYTLKLKVDGKNINLKFDDQMWMSHTGVMVNHAKFSKFGVHLGDVVVSFRK
ncbi:DUF3833 domain-containing protein [Burkholderiales bacterium]|nr:DUF3833 domain-containing protein [Burkholderiales bacterium]